MGLKEDSLKLHSDNVGKLEIKYKMNNNDYVIESISIYEK